MKVLLFGLIVISGFVLLFGGADLGVDAVRIVAGIMVGAFVLCLILPNKPSEPEQPEKPAE